MMKDELELLQSTITVLRAGEEIPVIDLEIHQQHILSETDRIKRAFVKEAFGMRKEKHVERYIQYHQGSLVAMIDAVVNSLPADQLELVRQVSTDLNRQNLLKQLYLVLEDLLTYIEKHFAKYFNQYAKSPESYRFIVHRDLVNKLPDIRYALEKKAINKGLLSIVLSPLNNFIEGINTQEVSYTRIIYLREMLSELDDLGSGRLTGERLDMKMCLTMAYLNFNTQKFFKYCVREINRIIQDQETLSRQLEKLAFLLKIVNQVQVKPGFMFNEKSGSLREQLSVWIAEEICFFEKRQQLTINFPVNADDPVQHDFKLKVSLSVAQLACLLRGLKDTGIITNNNILEVIRFVAGVVQTRHTEKISWDSLRTKFYNSDDTARNAVKDMALALFNYFRKELKGG